MRISPDRLRAWASSLLEASGMDAGDALPVADIFVRATLRGLGHHDISYLPGRLDWIRNHGVQARPRFERINQGPAFESWDAGCALGEQACRHALTRAMDVASRSGTGFVTMRRSNHFLAAAPYLEIASEAGFMALVWSNTDAGMSSPEGSQVFIGNNPMGFGIAATGHEAVNFDSCVAYSSLGNLKTMEDRGTPVPSWWGVDRSGSPALDARAILDGGAVRPLGGHKGFGMALMHECLTGLLGQGTTFDQVLPGGGVNTHNQTVLAFHLDSFGGRSAIEDRMGDLVHRMKAREPEVRIPGERSARRSREQQVSGIQLDAATRNALARWSRELGVDCPDEEEGGRQ